MSDEILAYYDRELAYLRRLAGLFAEEHPNKAERLKLDEGRFSDPHVERLLEGVAFLTARIHKRLDDGFSEVSEALLNVLFPQFLRPMPSFSLVRFGLDPEQGTLTSGVEVPRDSILYSRPIGGATVKFRTSYTTRIWPIEVEAAEWMRPSQLSPAVRGDDAPWAIRVVLRCFPDVRFSELEVDRLRFFLHGAGELPFTLYELLLNNCKGVLVRDLDDPDNAPLELPSTLISPVGFGEEEAILPLSMRSFVGHRLLQEYFAFREKFRFVDLGFSKTKTVGRSAFEAVRQTGFGSSVEIVFLITRFERDSRRHQLEKLLDHRSFQLGCTPIVNLFSQTSEPISLDRTRGEFRVVPDARRQRSTGVYSVNRVRAVTPKAERPVHFRPLFSVEHGDESGAGDLFWHTRREQSRGGNPDGTDLYISFSGPSGEADIPNVEAVVVDLTCHNGDLPTHLPMTGESPGEQDLQLPGMESIDQVSLLLRPTEPLLPPLGTSHHWRMVSLLAMGYMSFVGDGGKALREILDLQTFRGRGFRRSTGNGTDSTASEAQVRGVQSLRTSPCFSRLSQARGLTFVRGQAVEVEFDEEAFGDGGVFLFASVLERFLGWSVPLNSFLEFSARSNQREKIIKTWPPRAGARVLS